MQNLPDNADRLLQALLDARFDIAAVRPHFTATQIADLAMAPRFEERFHALQRLVLSLLTLQAAAARTKSMSGLEAAVDAAPNPIEKRRSATALLRASAAPLIPVSRAGATTGLLDTPQPPRHTPHQPPPPPQSQPPRRPSDSARPDLVRVRPGFAEQIAMLAGSADSVPGATAHRAGPADHPNHRLPAQPEPAQPALLPASAPHTPSSGTLRAKHSIASGP